MLGDTPVDKLVLPQANDVREPQDPVNIWIIAPEVLRFVPIPVSAMVALTAPLGVVYLYQTSSSGLPVAQPVGIPALAVANHTEPVALGTPLERVVAAAQSSFAGGGV